MLTIGDLFPDKGRTCSDKAHENVFSIIPNKSEDKIKLMKTYLYAANVEQN